jgi:hypothetical protein
MFIIVVGFMPNGIAGALKALFKSSFFKKEPS